MTFRAKITSKKVLFGTLLTLPSPEIAEILSVSEFDWLFIDLEHSLMGIPEVQQMLQSIGNRKPSLIRVSSSCEESIRKALDSGAQGLILPQIKSRKQIEELMPYLKFAPIGQRSVGLSRASGYGINLKNYLASANEEVAVVIQIEHIDAVENLDEILSVPNIDAVFVGPYDLSASMELPGEIENPKIQEATDKILNCCKKANVTAGIFAPNAESANSYREKGFSLIAIASDALFLSRGISVESKMIIR